MYPKKLNWATKEQIIFDCFVVCLRGLKNIGIISLTIHETILNIVQSSIDEKYGG